MTGRLLDLFLEMEREIIEGDVSPEDVVEQEQTTPGFKLWRRMRFKSLPKIKTEDEDGRLR